MRDAAVTCGEHVDVTDTRIHTQISNLNSGTCSPASLKRVGCSSITRGKDRSFNRFLFDRVMAVRQASLRAAPPAHYRITNPPLPDAPSDAQLRTQVEKTRRVAKPGLQALSGAIYSFRALGLPKLLGPGGYRTTYAENPPSSLRIAGRCRAALTRV